ncbi:MAG TPA: PEP-CTERM sorting domain-containing protein [Phycisphaerae bacterium]|nr:PEP-CTERM sorting domain-containing protein [Phycisphaerae bacterium]
MSMRSRTLLLSAAGAIAASFACLAPVQAGAVGAGPPVAQATSTNNTDPNNTWTSTLIAAVPNNMGVLPSPTATGPISIAAGGCPWVVNGLASAGFTAANNWTINYLPMSAKALTAVYYGAWTAPFPKVNLPDGGYYKAIGSDPDAGGATFEAQNNLGAAGSAAYGYIQAILTNDPLNANVVATAYNASGTYGNGFYEYLDNRRSSTNPNYQSAQGDQYLADQPGRALASFPGGVTQYPNGIIWEAQTFIDQVTPAAMGGGGTINIYGTGLWWGFQLTQVPEPAPFAFLLLGLTGMVLRRRQRPPVV